MFARRFGELRGKNFPAKERMPQKHCSKNLWLIKPANENQGKGIKILDDLEQINNFLHLEASSKFSYWVI